jgi:superfamily II DNA or RNA helicase
MIKIIDIEFENSKIYVVPRNDDDINFLHGLFLNKKYMNLNNGVWETSPHRLDELSTIFAPYSEKINVSKAFQRFAKFYREKFTEENKEGNKSRVVIYSYPNNSVIKTRKYPRKKIDNETKFFLKQAVRMKKFKNGYWDGYIHLMDKNSFPSGLLYVVKEILEKEGHPYKIVYKYDRRPQKKFDWVVDDNITPDPDQIEAIEKAYEAGRSVLKAPTGFGKTAILAKRLTAKFGVQTLFVANKKSLLDDAMEEFVSGIAGIESEDVGEIKDGVFGHFDIKSDTSKADIPDLDMPIIVATIQSLDSKLKDPRTRKKLMNWLKNVQFLMVDETQAVGTKTWDYVLDKVYAPYRAFLSATPKRTDGATIKIFARSGDVSFSTTAEEQIEKGRLSEVRIHYKVFDHKLYNQGDTNIEYHEAYAEWIVENEERNQKMIIEPALEMVNEGRHVLVLFQFIAHGERLRDMLIENGLDENDVRFIYGETKNEVRKNAIKEFRKGKFKVLVGSTIFDAGVNIPIISGIVMAGAGNSEITLIQRIGRSVRNEDYEELLGYLPEFIEEDGGEKIAKVVDVYDTNVKFFENQARNRYNIAKREFGSKRVFLEGQIIRPSKTSKKDRIKKERLDQELKKMETEMGGFKRKSKAESEDDLNLNFDDVMKSFEDMLN